MINQEVFSSNEPLQSPTKNASMSARTPPIISWKAVEEFFNKLDVDTKFYLTIQDITNFVMKLEIYPKYTTKLIDSMFTAADFDNDGKLKIPDIYNQIIPTKYRTKSGPGYESLYIYKPKPYADDWVSLIKLAVKDRDHIFEYDHNNFNINKVVAQCEADFFVIGGYSPLQTFHSMSFSNPNISPSASQINTNRSISPTRSPLIRTSPTKLGRKRSIHNGVDNIDKYLNKSLPERDLYPPGNRISPLNFMVASTDNTNMLSPRNTSGLPNIGNEVVSPSSNNYLSNSYLFSSTSVSNQYITPGSTMRSGSQVFQLSTLSMSSSTYTSLPKSPTGTISVSGALQSPILMSPKKFVSIATLNDQYNFRSPVIITPDMSHSATVINNSPDLLATLGDRNKGKDPIKVPLVMSSTFDDKLSYARERLELLDKYTGIQTPIFREEDTNYSFGGPELKYTSFLDKPYKIQQIPRGPPDPEPPKRGQSQPFKVLHHPIRSDIQMCGDRYKMNDRGDNIGYFYREEDESKRVDYKTNPPGVKSRFRKYVQSKTGRIK